MIKLSLIMKEEDVIVLNSEAMRYCQLHKFKKSIKCLEKAIKLEPKFALLWHSKGLVFTKMAVELVNDQIRMQKSGEAKEQHHHYAKLKLEEALECYDKAIELNPKDLKTWHDRGDVLEKLGILSFDKWFFQSAIECCDKVIELGQTSWESVDPNDNDGWDPKGIAAYEWMTKGMILYIHLVIHSYAAIPLGSHPSLSFGSTDSQLVCPSSITLSQHSIAD
jgi:tetratricopeptide (TPR) repeat protein